MTTSTGYIDETEILSDRDVSVMAATETLNDRALLTGVRKAKSIQLTFRNSVLILSVPDDIFDKLYPVIRRIAQLLELSNDMHSSGLIALDPLKISLSITCLQYMDVANLPCLPSVVSTENGGLQFEWHYGGVDLEIEVLSNDRVAFYYYNSNTDEEIEDVGDFKDTEKFISKLPSVSLS